MSEMQKKMWDTLCKMSGEDVARVFTNYFGNQLLNDNFHQYLIDEGWMEADETEDNEE